MFLDRALGQWLGPRRLSGQRPEFMSCHPGSPNAELHRTGVWFYGDDDTKSSLPCNRERRAQTCDSDISIPEDVILKTTKLAIKCE